MQECIINIINIGTTVLGGEDVIANLAVSNQNADQPIFDDITDMLRDDWLQIWDNLTMDEQQILIDRNPAEPISSNGWENEHIPRFRVMLEVLSCRVVSKIY